MDLKLLLNILLLISININFIYSYNTECYDTYGRAKKCLPEFVNAAFNLNIESTNTCGNPTIEFCIQSGLHHYSSSFTDSHKIKCDVCNAFDDRHKHPTQYLTDYNNQANQTWWQSETMNEGVQYPTSVNLTLKLGKLFDITYIQIKFHSPRPESFAIYKRTSENSEWVPYQYYSASCERTYFVQNSVAVNRDNEDVALCTDEFSDISPLTGGSVAFSTLENRPSAYSFETSEVLKEWVQAKEIKIVLNRLNTFGDEIFGDPQVLKSYYYAISDIAIGGRCKCNGHASTCSKSPYDGTHKCVCQHNTAGVDCEKCSPFYNDIPWQPATDLDAHECKPCSCNGLSNECYFDEDLYNRTGHGGHCVNCQGNTDGVHCDHCKDGFYRRDNDNTCIDCQCDPIGSESKQCDPSGKCKCKPGVVGEKCNRCAPQHYELSESGCKACTCNQDGSADQPAVCSPIDGSCRCKANVEGKNCDRCKPMFFDLSGSNPLGCLECFCFEHSSVCQSSSNYLIDTVSETSDESYQISYPLANQMSRVPYDRASKTVIVPYNTQSNSEGYLLLPSEYLGNKRLAYNQDLKFQLRLTNPSYAQASRKDLIIENANEGLEIYVPITSGGSYSQYPTANYQTFSFKLSQSGGWMPTLRRAQFQRLLSNITSIKIRVTYGSTDTYISNITLTSAKLWQNDLSNDYQDEPTSGQIATFVEQCTCTKGYTGQFCDLCEYEFKRENAAEGSYSRCIPCSCNNHSLSCNQIYGNCSCMHHTTGLNCELCEQGYYGNALQGTPNDCIKCPCPNNGPCIQVQNYQDNKVDIVCQNCPEGTTGNLCELCDDGYYNIDGPLSKCEKCGCNENIDPNAIGNCDPSTGNCLRCAYNTTGDRCERCLPGYWGNALTSLKCHSCDCYPPGTVESPNINANFEDIQCDLNDGKCNCKENVTGRQCNECKPGYFNITSGKGCSECKCNLLGSFNDTCDIETGQCYCRPGVTGLQCNQCLPNHYNFSAHGCTPCMCDPFGSVGSQCNELGKCTCKDNIGGKKCDRCEENKYNFTVGCLDCDECYNLVQKKINSLRNKISSIEKLINEFKQKPQSNNNNNDDESAELKRKLESLKQLIDDLHTKFFADQQLKSTYLDAISYFQGELKQIKNQLQQSEQSITTFENSFKNASFYYDKANNLLEKIKSQLKSIQDGINENKQKLQEIKEIYNNDNEQQLKELAKQAREAATIHKEIADNITSLVENGIKEARDSLGKLNSILNDYNQLKQMLSGQSFNYDQIRNKTTHLIQDAKHSKEMLNDQLEDIKRFIKAVNEFKLPSIYQDGIEDKANQEFIENTQNEINSFRNELNKLKTDADKYTNFDAKRALDKAKQKFETIKNRLRDINDLYNKVQQAKNLTVDSIQDLEKTYENATTILKTLEDFDKNVDESKQKANDALSKKNEIEDNLKKSKELVHSINDNIQSLEIKPVNKPNIDLNKLNDDSNMLRQKTNDLDKKSRDLENKFDQLKTVNELSDTNEKLSQKHTNLTQIVDNLQASTVSLSSNLTNALGKIDEIGTSISNYNLNNVTLDDVRSMKDKFDKISEEIDKTLNNQEKFDSLKSQNQKLQAKLEDTELVIKLLEQQVADLDRLNKTLPRTCFTGSVSVNEPKPIQS